VRSKHSKKTNQLTGPDEGLPIGFARGQKMPLARCNPCLFTSGAGSLLASEVWLFLLSPEPEGAAADSQDRSRTPKRQTICRYAYGIGVLKHFIYSGIHIIIALFRGPA
jgi:hypothetical protein